MAERHILGAEAEQDVEWLVALRMGTMADHFERSGQMHAFLFPIEMLVATV